MALTQHQALTGAELHVPQVHDLLRHIIGGADARLNVFRAYCGGAQNINNVTDTPVQLSAVDFNTDGGFNTGTYLYTAAVAGYRFVVGQLRYNNIPNASFMDVLIKKNGADEIVARITSGVAQDHTVVAAGLIYLAVGDTCGMSAYQSSGGARAVDITRTQTFFCGIGPF